MSPTVNVWTAVTSSRSFFRKPTAMNRMWVAPMLTGASLMAAVFQTLMLTASPSAEVRPTMCWPSGEIDTSEMAAARVRSRAEGGVEAAGGGDAGALQTGEGAPSRATAQKTASLARRDTEQTSLVASDGDDAGGRPRFVRD